MVEDKAEKGLSMLYVAVVNIVKLRTRLLLLSKDEVALAKAAFRNSIMEQNHEQIMDLGGLVSRKKDFIPAITRAIKDGFQVSPSTKATITRRASDVFLPVNV